MEKRLVLFIILALAILIGWPALMKNVYHIDNKAVTTLITNTTHSPAPSISSVVSPEANKLPGADLSNAAVSEVTLDKIKIDFIDSLASIKQISFPSYQSHKFYLGYGFLLGDKNLTFKKERISHQEAVFVGVDKDKRITKKFIFSKSNYIIELDIECQNISNSPLHLNLPLLLGVLDTSRDPAQVQFQDITISTNEKLLHNKGQKNMSFDSTKFLGFRDRYFCAIIEPLSEGYNSFAKKLSNKETEMGLTPKDITIAPGQSLVQKFRIYLGPQDLQIITPLNPDWTAVMYYGTFDPVSHILLQFLDFLYKFTHNWGWAIIILSIAVYLVLFPLNLKQMRSMKEMQALQPHIEELRRAYKDNPQKLNKEIMDLYRTHKVNPFGGCLPLLLQIPIFFALYQALMRSIALKGASFLWIKDLSEPDRLFVFSQSIPILGNEINILPILMAIGMFIQQKLSMSSASSTSAQQQKMMMVVLPVMFGLIFYRMPSGLVLYWFVNSTLMLIYQFRLSRIK